MAITTKKDTQVLLGFSEALLGFQEELCILCKGLTGMPQFTILPTHYYGRWMLIGRQYGDQVSRSVSSASGSYVKIMLKWCPDSWAVECYSKHWLIFNRKNMVCVGNHLSMFTDALAINLAICTNKPAILLVQYQIFLNEIPRTCVQDSNRNYVVASGVHSGLLKVA